MDAPRTLQQAIVYFADYQHCHDALVAVRGWLGQLTGAAGAERQRTHRQVVRAITPLAVDLVHCHSRQPAQAAGVEADVGSAQEDGLGGLTGVGDRLGRSARPVCDLRRLALR